MDILEKYLKELDYNNFDHTNASEIERELQSIRDSFIKQSYTERAKIAQLEMEVFSFTIRVDDYQLSLSYRFASEGENEKGEKIRIEWPDTSIYTPEDFMYIFKRFNETKNYFLKSEYGFVLLLAKNSRYKNDTIALDILESLLYLTSKYKTFVNEDLIDKKHYSLYLHLVLEEFFVVAYSRKKNEQFVNYLKVIKEIMYNVILDWNVKHQGSRFMTDLVLLISNFNSEFKDYNLELVLDKLWELSNYLKSEYIHGSINVAQIGIKFSQKLNLENKYNWRLLIAQDYELLAKEAKERKDSTYISFIEDALRMYEILKDERKIFELRGEFIDAKQNYKFPSITTKISNDLVKESIERVNTFFDKANSNDVMHILLTTPMISKLEVLREVTKRMYSETPLMAMISKSVVDKMGNTIAEYKHDDKEALFNYNLLYNYKLEFQFALDEISYFFTTAIKKNLLSATLVLDFMNKSWIGQRLEKVYNGKIKNITLLTSIESQIVEVFEEINKIIENEKAKINVIQCIDSLTLKFEYFFRFLAEKLGIPTFTNKSKENKNINEERSLNSLLEDKKLVENFQKGSIEDDLFLFKFIFIEKAGWNLRNEIAHGLMDSDEYNYQQAIILVIIFLKLCSYNFKTT